MSSTSWGVGQKAPTNCIYFNFNNNIRKFR